MLCIMVEKYKIVHDRETCIGCAACASVCPKYWEMNSDGKSDVIGAEKSEEYYAGGEVLELSEDYDCNKEAADSCPVNCIHLHEVKEDGSEEKLI